MRPVLASVLVAALTVPAAAAGTAVAPYVVHGDRSAGGIVIARSKPAAAIARFGAPASRKADGVSCLVHWPRLRVAIRFLDFERRPCRNGVAVTVTITGRGHWRTAVGLRVGDPLARLRSLYPRAALRRGGFRPYVGYWLVPRRACAEVGAVPYPGLLARVSRGRVAALVVATTACE